MTEDVVAEEQEKVPFFNISLAQWSLHKKYEEEGANPFDFAKDAKALGFNAVEYVTQIYEDHVRHMIYEKKEIEEQRYRGEEGDDSSSDGGRKGGEECRQIQPIFI